MIDRPPLPPTFPHLSPTSDILPRPTPTPTFYGVWGGGRGIESFATTLPSRTKVSAGRGSYWTGAGPAYLSLPSQSQAATRALPAGECMP